MNNMQFKLDSSTKDFDEIFFNRPVSKIQASWVGLVTSKNVSIKEVSSWDDRSYSNTMYKAYKIDNDKDLTYILLKWDVMLKGDYNDWKALRDSIENTVFTDEDIKWIEQDD